MKILYLITKGERGGAQSHVWTLMERQRFAKPILALGADGFLGDQARNAGVPVHFIPHLVHPIQPVCDLQATFELIRLIRSERPDLIHAHTAKAGIIGRVAGFLTHTPTVYTVHAWSFTAMQSQAMTSMCVWLERGLKLMNQTLIDVSRFNFDMAEQKRVAPRDHRIIWNGVPDCPQRATFGKDGGPVKIIMVARLAPPKDHCLLMDALATVPRNWQCTFVGSGPDDEKIKTHAQALGIDGDIRFLGDRDDIPELLADSHLFVLCSNSESLPISIIEAMRAGLPVLSSAVGGCSELVQDGKTGFLVKPGDVQQLRQRLAHLLASRRLLELFGSEGRARYEEHFGVQGMVNETVAAYARMTAGALLPGPNESLVSAS
jgi:glycosyltransferase involved in cell wall biosynthesis